MKITKRLMLIVAIALLAVVELGCEAPNSTNGTSATANNADGHDHALVEITSANFDEMVTNSSTPVLLDFWAPWCGPCVKMTPTMEELATKYAGKFLIGKVNVDEQPDLAQKYDASAIPLIVFFKGGNVAKTSVGLQPKEVIEADMKALLE